MNVGNRKDFYCGSREAIVIARVAGSHQPTAVIIKANIAKVAENYN